MSRATYGTEITSALVGKAKDDDGWEHYSWTVTLTRDGKTRTVPFRMGLGHVQTRCGKPWPSIGRGSGRWPVCGHVRCQTAGPVPTPPSLYDVLCSLKADSTGGETFADWCSDLGYDTDSRKAMSTYLACQQSEVDSRAFFGADWSSILDDEDYA